MSSKIVGTMDCLLILDETKSAISKHLKAHFSLFFDTVVVADNFTEGDQYIIDLNLLNAKKNSIAENTFSFENARKYANYQHKEGMYIFVGSSNFKKIRDTNTSGYFGLAKTAALEWQDIFVKAIGFEAVKDSKKVAYSIFQELFKGGLESEIFYDTDLERYELDLNLKNQQTQLHELQESDLIIVTGGGRGVTADCIIALAKKQKLKFAILGRTELFKESIQFKNLLDEKQIKSSIIKDLQIKDQKIDLQSVGRKSAKIIANRSIQKNLETLQSLGSEAIYYATNITNEKELAKVIDQIKEQQGTINGLIHGAGVLADKYIKDKQDEQFSRVFDTKVKGFQYILKELKSEQVRHICCFTSVAGRFGNTGQSDYAMANEVLNKLCIKLKQEKGIECNVKALNWGPWEGGMVTPTLKQHFEKMGIQVIERESGTKAFVEEFLSKGATAEVVIGIGLDNWKKQVPKKIEFATRIHDSTFPIINDHVIKGMPVMPMVSIINQALYLGSYYFGTNEVSTGKLRVLKGIKVEEFRDKGLTLNYKITILNEKEIEIKVFTLSVNLPNYSVIVKNNKAKTLVLPELSNVTGRTFQKEELITKTSYFHGPNIRAIKSIAAYATDGANFMVDKLSKGNYKIKLMDGAMQAACIQAGIMAEEEQAVPLGCDSVSWYKVPEFNTELMYKLRINEAHELEFTSDIQLIDKNSHEIYLQILGTKVFIYDKRLKSKV